MDEDSSGFAIDLSKSTETSIKPSDERSETSKMDVLKQQSKVAVPLPSAPNKPFFRFAPPLPRKPAHTHVINQLPPNQNVRSRTFLNAPPNQNTNRAIRPRYNGVHHESHQNNNQQIILKGSLPSGAGSNHIAPRPATSQRPGWHNNSGMTYPQRMGRVPPPPPNRFQPPPLISASNLRPIPFAAIGVPRSTNSLQPPSSPTLYSASDEVPRHNSPFMTPLANNTVAKQEQPLKQTRVAFRNSPEFSLVHVQHGSPPKKHNSIIPQQYAPIVPKPMPASFHQQRPLVSSDIHKLRGHTHPYIQPRPSLNHTQNVPQHVNKPIAPSIPKNHRFLNPSTSMGNYRSTNGTMNRPGLIPRSQVVDTRPRSQGVNSQQHQSSVFEQNMTARPILPGVADPSFTVNFQNMRPTTNFKVGQCYKPAPLNIDLSSVVSSAKKLSDLFSWTNYLKETKSSAANMSCFPHLKNLSKNGLSEGFLIEVPTDDSITGFWVASIIYSTHQSLLVRYAGFSDSSGDKWINLMSTPIHAVGWSTKSKRGYTAPKGFSSGEEDCRSFLNKFLSNKFSITEDTIKSRGYWPIEERIPKNCRFEFEYEPNKVWMVRVIENYSGLLYLRYEGVIDDPREDVVQFFTSKKLHMVGYAVSTSTFIIHPPEFLLAVAKEQSLIEVYKRGITLSDQIVANFVKDPIDKCHKPPLHYNTVTVGMKLEVLSTTYPNHIYPATVVDIVDDRHIRVAIDDLSLAYNCKKRPSQVIHGSSFGVFPVNWCYENNLPLACPNGFNREIFNWNEYLMISKSSCVPLSFFKALDLKNNFNAGEKLEISNPLIPKCVSPVTVLRSVDRLLIVEIDGWVNALNEPITVYLDSQSDLLFPIRFCDGVEKLDILPPPNYDPNDVSRCLLVDDTEKKADITSKICENALQDYSLKISPCALNRPFWCNVLFVNYQCRIGSLFSRYKIACLSQTFGPGLSVYVLRTLVTSLINCSLTPSQALKELLSICTSADFEGNTCTVQVKAKFKTKNMKATVRFPEKYSDAMPFLKCVLRKLGCCENLFDETDSTGKVCSSPECLAGLVTVGDSLNDQPDSPSSFGSLMPKKKCKNRKRKKRRNFFTLGKRRAITTIGGTMESRTDGNSDESNQGSRPATPKSDSGDDDLEKLITIEPKRGFIKLRKLHDMTPPEREKSKRHKSVFSTVNMIARQDDPVPSVSSSKVFRPISPCNNNTAPSPVPVEPKHETNDKVSDPVNWSTEDLCNYLESTDCVEFTETVRKESIDGQAFLLTSLPVLVEACNLKLGMALKVCYETEKLKRLAIRVNEK